MGELRFPKLKGKGMSDHERLAGGVTEGVVTDSHCASYHSIPRYYTTQRSINTAHGHIELRAHCTPKEFADITETSKLLGLHRAMLVRWFVLYGSRATRAYLDGKDDDPNPS
jgi:hypothetical protein